MQERAAIVVTGASAGIGLVALETLAEESFVLAISRTEPDTRVPNHLWMQGDLREPDAIATRIERFLDEHERTLEGVIHCAASYGATRRHALIDSADDEWDETMDVNVRSQFVLTRRLLPLLPKRHRAFIVALTSDVATQPAPNRIPYACSKAASYALFTSLAAELSESAVSVIQLQPTHQVVTRGLRARRPPDFDFSGYSSPRIFAPHFRAIARSGGHGMNGRCVLVS